jgi:hypothetical protein
MCSKPCKDCPFRKDSLPGWLGAYETAEEFIGIHYQCEIRNPCHMTVDYTDPNWREGLEEASPCAGQAVMFRNSGKLPRNWTPIDVEVDREHVFTWPPDFIKHHNQRDS